MKKNILLLTALLLLSIYSCRKTENPTYFDVITTSKDEALIQSLFDDAQNESEKQHIASQDDALKSELTDSVIVTVDGGANGFEDTAWTITIDYGDGYTNKYGWVKRGKINIAVTGFYRMKGSKRVMTFDNYFVNNQKVEGQHVVENIGFDSTTLAYNFKVTVTNGKLTLADGKIITWESERNRAWTKGYDTPLSILDDEYSITGEAHGVNSEGKAFTKTIIQPLVIRPTCQFIQKGIIDISIEGEHMANVDYEYGYVNDQTCDKQAQVVTKNRTFNIEIQR
ncbi:MAG TPA: hypothetical protein P5243_00090 [Bacteroidales bacterium]|jgi:hypothetical protein|nr:hypothetical protein [Bacteroidales bacterium]HRS17873.1 hypothetical protein [Bacteroidales bacterium]